MVLIHGLASSRVLMWPLAWHIRRAGLSTHCYGYSSCLFSIEHHGTKFRKFLDRQAASQRWSDIRIVAHSLGAIVTRQAFREATPDYLSRVLMLGAPQEGSPNATWLSDIGLGFIKTLDQISDREDSFVRQLPHLQGPEVGSIAASYDFVVPQSNSHAQGQVDYARPFSGHNGLLVRPRVARLVTQFLTTGRFDEANESAMVN